MKEIEIKAHVYDTETVKVKLNSFADYDCFMIKDDTYYHIPSPSSTAGHVTVRIRKEMVQKNSETFSRIYFTYKKKENRISPDGTNIEVNEENECFVTDEMPIVKAILDAGGNIDLTKRKKSYEWHYSTPFGLANIELVEVEKLGWFLETEIVGNDENEKHFSEIKKTIEEIILKAGIPLENIETRYYSDLLKEKI